MRLFSWQTSDPMQQLEPHGLRPAAQAMHVASEALRGRPPFETGADASSRHTSIITGRLKEKKRNARLLVAIIDHDGLRRQAKAENTLGS